MPVPDSIATYLRLCGRPHKRKYVGISVMLSRVIKDLSRATFFKSDRPHKTGLRAPSRLQGICFDCCDVG